jgi:hypothetical protein
LKIALTRRGSQQMRTVKKRRMIVGRWGEKKKKRKVS